MRHVVDSAFTVDAAERSIDMQNLAFILYLQGKLQESARIYGQALILSESTWGSDSLAVADNLFGIVGCLRRSGKFEEVEPVIQRMLEIRLRQLGPSHRLVGNTLLDLAVNYERQGKFADAEPTYVRALSVRELQFGKDSRNNIPCLVNYAGLLRKINKTEAADSVDARIAELSSRPFDVRDNMPDIDRSGWLFVPRPADSPVRCQRQSAN